MTDTELVSKIKKGDMAAFDKLVTEYNKRVINIAYSLLSDREDALDAAQEVFEGLQEHRKLPRRKHSFYMDLQNYEKCLHRHFKKTSGNHYQPRQR